jgi:hypothetical protein
MHKELLSKFQEKHPDIPIIMGATTVLKFHDSFIFSLNKEKYWKDENGLKIGFSGVGGKVEDGESPKEAAIREVKEEVGQDISLIPFPKTIFVSESGEKKELAFNESPAYIAEFISPGVPGNQNKPGYWGLLLFVFAGTVNNEPAPTEEIPGIISFTKDTFNLVHNDNISYSEMIAGGSKVIAHKTIPESALFQPTFSAKIISDMRINPDDLFKE